MADGMSLQRHPPASNTAPADERLFTATLMPDDDWWHALWPNPLAVLQAVGIEPGMEVVDLCCGSGHFAVPLCQWVWPGRVWGVELDPGLLDEAQRHCARHDNFHPLEVDARELNRHIAHPVDFVFIANTFHGVDDKGGLATAIHDIVKPGGHLAVINWQPLPREHTTVFDKARGPDTALRMPPQQVRQVVEPAGFMSQRVFEVGPYHYAALFMRDEGLGARG